MAQSFLFAVLVVFAVTFIMLMVANSRRAARPSPTGYDSRAPQMTSRAYVVDKRTDVTASLSQGGDTQTRYYTTFELPSGQRLEFELPGSQYGQLVVGDVGELVWQSTRLQDYRRELPR